MFNIYTISLVICTVWPAPCLRADAKPPARLTELETRLKDAGCVVYLHQFDEWEIWVEFPNKIDDDALKPLYGIRGVTMVRILKGGVTDKVLAQLKNLSDLKTLVVDSKEITDAGMESIGNLKSLTKLDLLVLQSYLGWCPFSVMALHRMGLVFSAPYRELNNVFWSLDRGDDDLHQESSNLWNSEWNQIVVAFLFFDSWLLARRRMATSMA